MEFKMVRQKLITRLVLLAVIVTIILGALAFALQNKSLLNSVPRARAATSNYLDGNSNSVGTSEGLIDSLSTSLPSGDNIIIASIALNRASTTNSSIGAGNLKLRRGNATGTVLASNEYILSLGNTTAKSTLTYNIIYKDASAPSNPTYTITAFADTTGVSAEVKMLVINGVSNSSYTDGSSTSIGTSEVSVGSSTMSPSGENVIIAAVQMDNSNASTQSITAGNLKISKSCSTSCVQLVTNKYDINLDTNGAGRLRSRSMLLIARESSASANTDYDVRATSSSAVNVSGEAKIIVLNSISSSFLDTSSATTVSTGSETTVGTVNTTFSAGENVVLAGIEMNGSATTGSVDSGNERIKAGASTVSSNEYAITMDGTGTTRRRQDSLMYRDSSAAANASYSLAVISTTVTTDMYVKLLALNLPASSSTTTVGSSGSQTSSLTISATGQYIGGAFTFITDTGTVNVTSITISETGTVSASTNLSNLKLYYETAGTCIYNGNETVFNSAGVSFNGSEKATVTGTISVSASQVCLYALLDLNSGAVAGQTLDLEITNPSTDVTVSSGSVTPSSSSSISGSTTLVNPGLNQLMRHGRWFNNGQKQPFSW